MNYNPVFRQTLPDRIGKEHEINRVSSLAGVDLTNTVPQRLSRISWPR
jgi:hypothetical protein